MLLPSGSRAFARERAYLLSTFALLVALTGAACGVPISASEMTATAVTGGSAQEQSAQSATLGAEAPTASRSVGSAPPSSLTPLAPLVTSTPSALAAASVTPAVTGTPSPAASETASPTGTGTPSTSVTPNASVTASPSATASPTPDASALTSEALRLLNEYRVKDGRPALRINTTLTAGANAYARLMAERNHFGHDGPDGSTPTGRVKTAGYPGSFKGEALAAGQTNAASAISTWLNSPSHANILLDPAAVEIGIGFAYDAKSYYGSYWVLVTGVP